MELVKFVRHHGVYTPGDIAGFAPDVAARLLALKAAEKVDESAAAPPAPQLGAGADEPKRRGRQGKESS